MGYVVQTPKGYYYNNGGYPVEDLQEAKVYKSRNTGGKTGKGKKSTLVEVKIVKV